MQVQKKLDSKQESKIPNTIPLKDYYLNNPWILWYHHELDNWKTSGYRKIFTINTIKPNVTQP
jgi:hypothetical protein